LVPVAVAVPVESALQIPPNMGAMAAKDSLKGKTQQFKIPHSAAAEPAD
jgi:hypothetical protein